MFEQVNRERRAASSLRPCEKVFCCVFKDTIHNRKEGGRAQQEGRRERRQEGNREGRQAATALPVINREQDAGRENAKKSSERHLLCTPTPAKNFRFRSRAGCAKWGYNPNTPDIYYLYAMYNDLTVRNGRLINNRPNDVTGIQQAAQIKKDLKREQKIAMMEEAMYRAEMRSNLMESMMEGKKK